MKVKELQNLIAGEREVKDLSAVNDFLDKLLSADEEAEVTEEAAEETTEEVEETEDEPEMTEEAEVTEEAEGAEDAGADDGDDTEAPAEEEGTVNLAAVNALIESLSAKVTDLEARLAETQQRLSAKEAEEKAFTDKFKKLSAAIREDKKPEVKVHQIGMTNGIGEL